MAEERDQRDIFRGTFTNLIANSTYTLLITYIRNNREKVENTFHFKTLPLQNLVLKITSNVLESQKDISIQLNDTGKLILSAKAAKPDLFLIVGEIASDFGFKTGYFLHDLFIKKLSERYTKDILTPFLVVSGPFDHSQNGVDYSQYD